MLSTSLPCSLYSTRMRGVAASMRTESCALSPTKTQGRRWSVAAKGGARQEKIRVFTTRRSTDRTVPCRSYLLEGLSPDPGGGKGGVDEKVPSKTVAVHGLMDTHLPRRWHVGHMGRWAFCPRTRMYAHFTVRYIEKYVNGTNRR